MKSRVCALFGGFVFLAALCGCKGDRLLEPDRATGASSANMPHTPNTKPVAVTPPPSAGPRIQFVKAAGGEVAPLVKTERENADKGQRSFLVYVGAGRG